MESVRITFGERQCTAPRGTLLIDVMSRLGIAAVHTKGCRNGICGSCVLRYRLPSDRTVFTVLACRTPVESDMVILSFGADEVTPSGIALPASEQIGDILTIRFPELTRCRKCGLCSAACPQGIDVRTFVGMAMRNDIGRCAEASFACVMCGACAKKCVAGIRPSEVAMAARRINGVRAAKRTDELSLRISALKNENYEKQHDAELRMTDNELRTLYDARTTED